MATACQVCEVHAESVFKIEGMDCHEEVAILERRLKGLSGLEALHADMLGQRLTIKYDAAKLTTSTIAEAVAQTGMRAWLEHERAGGAGAVRRHAAPVRRRLGRPDRRRHGARVRRRRPTAPWSRPTSWRSPAAASTACAARCTRRGRWRSTSTS